MEETITIDDTVFSNSDSINCPLTVCTIHAENDCGGSTLSSTEITLSDKNTNPWTLTLSTMDAFSTNVCLRCTNGDQTVDLDNWTIMNNGCGALTSDTLDGVIPDITVAYNEGADHTAAIDYDTVFGNPDTADCPFLACFLLLADCNEEVDITTSYPSFADEVYIDFDGLTLMVETDHAAGYSYTLCLWCSNGEYLATNANLNIIQTS